MVTVGCNANTRSEGPTKTICGKLISPTAGAPGVSGGWYQELVPGKTKTLRLPAYAQVTYWAAPWIRVSSSCSEGASVTISPTGHMKIIDSIASGDGKYVAVRLLAYLPGTVTVRTETVRGEIGTLAVSIYTPPTPTTPNSPT